jgi:protein-disulfide isomerase
MLAQNRKIPLIIIAVVVILGALYAFSQGNTAPTPENAATAQTAETQTPSTEASATEAGATATTTAETTTPADVTPRDPANLNIDELMQDRALGNPNAPVKMVEYASFTCSHCTDFHVRTFQQIKMAYIDTGKVYYIFREYPLDNIALSVSKIARCAPDGKYFNLVDVIFHNRDRWILQPDPLGTIANYAKLAGVNEELFKACSTNEALETALLKQMGDAQTTFKVSSTPTFIFNDGAETLSGSRSFDEFSKVIDGLIAGQKN